MIKLVQDLKNFLAKRPDREQEAKRTVELIQKQGERCLYRDCWDDGHITGSLFVFNPSRSKVLLMHHLKFDQWQQFGGHADGDPDILATAIREFQEEAGVDIVPEVFGEDIFDVEIHHISSSGDEPSHMHYDIRYAATISENVSFTCEEGKVGGIEWVEIERVGEYNDREWFEKVIKKTRSR